jgi:cardiolipin synthase
VAVETLVEARKRGVDVRIMISSERNDNWLARHNSIALSGRLLEAGVEMLEYTRTMLHQKTMVVDGVWSTIGTTNFDNRSFAHNEETNVCVFDRDLAGWLEATFMDDVAGCSTMTLESWRRRGILSRLQEFVASLLRDQA